MKKSFIKVALFGVLAITAANFVGCTDYDDDIKNLQGQIDDINGKVTPLADINAAIEKAISSLKAELTEQIGDKANNADVLALQAKVTELVNELNGKADEDTVAKLVEEINALTAKVNSIEASSATKEELAALQKSVENWKKELEDLIAKKADQASVDALAAKITKAEDDIKALDERIKGNADAIATLQSKIGELENLKTRLSTLEGIVNGLPANLNTRLESIEAWKNSITGTIITTTNLKDNLNEYIKNFVTLKDVQDQLKNYISKNGLDAALAEEIKNADSTLGQIKASIDALDEEVKGIKNMIQSVVWIPSEIDYSPEYFATISYNNKVIAQTKEISLQFRVSPAEAVERLNVENSKLTIAFDAPMTRSLTLPKITKIDGDSKTGIISITVAPTSDDTQLTNYISCLSIKEYSDDKKTQKTTDITSTYFGIVSNPINLTSVTSKVSFGDQTLKFNDESGKVDYSSAKLYVNSESTSLEDMGIDTTPFKTEVTLDGTDKALFTLTGKVVTIKDKNQSASIGKFVNVGYKITITGTNYENVQANGYGKVTIANRDAADKDYSFETQNYTWTNKADQTKTFDMTPVVNKSGLTNAEFAALTAPTLKADNGVKLELVGTPGSVQQLKVTVPAGTPEGTYKPTAVYQLNNLDKLTVTAPVVVSYDKENLLVKNEAVWNNNELRLTPVFKPAADKYSSMTIEMDLENTAFRNYSTVEGKEATIEATMNTVTGVTLSGNKITVDATAYKHEAIKLTIKVFYGATATANNTIQTINATVKVLNPLGTLTASNKEYANAAINMKGLLTMTDERKKNIYADGNVITGNDKNGFAQGTNAFTLYGISTSANPAVEFVEVTGISEADLWATIDQAAFRNGTFQRVDQQYATTKAFTVKVKAIVKTAFEDYTATFEINVPEGSK